MSSHITYWKLDKPLGFGGKPNMLDAVQILPDGAQVGTGRITISYVEGWTQSDDLDIVTAIFVPPGTGIKTFTWSGPGFISEKKKLLTEAAALKPTADLESYMLTMFYEKLGASKPEYAGTLVVQDVA